MNEEERIRRELFRVFGQMYLRMSCVKGLLAGDAKSQPLSMAAIAHRQITESLASVDAYFTIAGKLVGVEFPPSNEVNHVSDSGSGT